MVMNCVNFQFIVAIIWLFSTVGVKIVKNHVSSVRYCELCDLKFKRIIEFERHINGKRHQDQVWQTDSHVIEIERCIDLLLVKQNIQYREYMARIFFERSFMGQRL